jgi:hypothetical protein
MNFNNLWIIQAMQKPIRLKEINRVGQRIRTVRNLQSNNNSYQPTGASAVLDPKTKAVKELFQMFGVKPKV